MIARWEVSTQMQQQLILPLSFYLSFFLSVSLFRPKITKLGVQLLSREMSCSSREDVFLFSSVRQKRVLRRKTKCPKHVQYVDTGFWS